MGKLITLWIRDQAGNPIFNVVSPHMRNQLWSDPRSHYVPSLALVHFASRFFCVGSGISSGS